MGSSYISLRYHVVFATKDRSPVITQEIRPQLYRYMAGFMKAKEAGTIAIGGVADHVHLLIWLRSTHQVSEFVRLLKLSSAKWMRESLNLRGFAWQEGYGAFTVSPSACPAVRDYIANQEKHHRRLSYKVEFVRFLEMAGVEYDPQYLD